LAARGFFKADEELFPVLDMTLPLSGLLLLFYGSREWVKQDFHENCFESFNPLYRGNRFMKKPPF